MAQGCLFHNDAGPGTVVDSITDFRIVIPVQGYDLNETGVVHFEGMGCQFHAYLTENAALKIYAGGPRSCFTFQGIHSTILY